MKENLNIDTMLMGQRLNMKMPFFPKLIQEFDIIPNVSPRSLGKEFDKLFLNSMWKFRGPGQMKQVSKRNK
jgi:hypothetical protein